MTDDRTAVPQERVTVPVTMIVQRPNAIEGENGNRHWHMHMTMGGGTGEDTDRDLKFRFSSPVEGGCYLSMNGGEESVCLHNTEFVNAALDALRIAQAKNDPEEVDLLQKVSACMDATAASIDEWFPADTHPQVQADLRRLSKRMRDRFGLHEFVADNDGGHLAAEEVKPDCIYCGQNTHWSQECPSGAQPVKPEEFGPGSAGETEYLREPHD